MENYAICRETTEVFSLPRHIRKLGASGRSMFLMDTFALCRTRVVHDLMQEITKEVLAMDGWIICDICLTKYRANIFAAERKVPHLT